MFGNLDLIPGINVGNAFRQIATGVDHDIIPGLSGSGGARTTVGGTRVGITQPSQGSPLSSYNPANGGQTANTGTDQRVLEWSDQNRVGGGFGTSDSTFDPEEQAARLQIDQGINQANDALGRLDRQQQSAFGNIGNDYNSAYNRLLGHQAQARTGFETNKTNQLQDYQTAREDVANNSRNLLVGARRLLGAQGAGGGSADRYAAPNAAQIEGSKNNAIVQKTNSRNLAALTAAQEDADRQFKDSFGDLDRQKETTERGTRSQFEQQRADILNTIATLTGQRSILNGQNYSQALAAAQPYTSRIGSILDSIDRLAVNPGVIREQRVNVARPNLDQYAYDRFSAPRANAPAQQDQSLLSPGVAALLGTEEQRQRELV